MLRSIRIISVASQEVYLIQHLYLLFLYFYSHRNNSSRLFIWPQRIIFCFHLVYGVLFPLRHRHKTAFILIVMPFQKRDCKIGNVYCCRSKFVPRKHRIKIKDCILNLSVPIGWNHQQVKIKDINNM